VGRPEVGRVLVDFGNLAFPGSTALALLLRLRRGLHAWGGQLTLCRLSPQVYEIFEATKLHTLFDIQSTPGPGWGSGGGTLVG
jgi:anti-anti-sigma factor